MDDTDICKRLRREVAWEPALMAEAASEIERLRQERNHWMATAMAFDSHLATMRVMMMEHPTVRFDGPRY